MSLCVCGDKGDRASSCVHENPSGQIDKKFVGAEVSLSKNNAAFQVQVMDRRSDPRTCLSGQRDRCRASSGGPSATALYGRGLSIEKVPAVRQRQTATKPKLITLGMAAEIIMVVENKDTSGFVPRKRSRCAADRPLMPAAHNHKIVGLVYLCDLIRLGPKMRHRAGCGQPRSSPRGFRVVR